MSDRDFRAFLRDILEAGRRIGDNIEGLSYESFRKDTKTQDAVIRNLEIIGEAAKNISDAERARYQELPWKGMAGMRDRLIHGYFGVNLDIVWAVITTELPDILPTVEAILDKRE